MEADVAWEERNEVSCHTYWANAWTAAAVRDSESLVEVKVAHISADEAWAGETDLSVHISAVHIHLAAILMDCCHKGADAVLIDTVCRRISDHKCGEVILILCCFSLCVFEVDVTVLIAFHDNHL